jgi:hypothetical protein
LSEAGFVGQIGGGAFEKAFRWFTIGTEVTVIGRCELFSPAQHLWEVGAMFV